MASKISEKIEEEKEKLGKRFSEDNVKGFWGRTKKRLASISHGIGIIFAIGATIGLIGGLGTTLPLALTSAAFFVAPSVPKIWRKLTGKVNKTKKNATSIEVKENTDLNDACKEFEKAVSEIREKFSKDNHATKTDYERMKKYYDILLTKKAFELGLINEEDIEFFKMYEETYNEQLKDFIRGTKKTNEKETEFNKKISTLNSRYETLKEKLNGKSYVLEDVVVLGKDLAKYYDEVDNYASSNGMKDKFDDFVNKNGIKSFILTDVVKIIKDSENYQKLDDEMNALKAMKEDLSAKIQSGNESKETLKKLLENLFSNYKKTLDFSISIGEEKYFNAFIKNNGIDTFMKETAIKLNEVNNKDINDESKKNLDKDDKKNTDNKPLFDRFEVLKNKFEILKSAIASRKLNKIEVTKMARDYANYYREIYVFADSIGQLDMFKRFVSAMEMDTFLYKIANEIATLGYVDYNSLDEEKKTQATLAEGLNSPPNEPNFPQNESEVVSKKEKNVNEDIQILVDIKIDRKNCNAVTLAYIKDKNGEWSEEFNVPYSKNVKDIPSFVRKKVAEKYNVNVKKVSVNSYNPVNDDFMDLADAIEDAERNSRIR